MANESKPRVGRQSSTRNVREVKKLLRAQEEIQCLDMNSYVTVLATALEMSLAGIKVSPASKIHKPLPAVRGNKG